MIAPTSRHRVAELGALLAEPARAGILLALIDGSARPAGELAALAGIGAAAASEHLHRLVDGGLLVAQAQGRHRYYRLADDRVAQIVESFALAAASPAPSRAVRTDAATRRARTCYRHLAGRLGVALFDALRVRGGLRIDGDAIRLEARGSAWLHANGLLDDEAACQRLAGRSCVDWTERRFHLAGPLGDHLARRLLETGWLRRREGSRALAIAPAGRSGLRALGIEWEML